MVRFLFICSSHLSTIFDDCIDYQSAIVSFSFLDIVFQFLWPPFDPWTLLFNSFDHRSIRGHCFSISLATVWSVDIAFQFLWPPFDPWTLLFNSFDHRSIRGHCFSILLVTVHSSVLLASIHSVVIFNEQ